MFRHEQLGMMLFVGNPTSKEVIILGNRFEVKRCGRFGVKVYRVMGEALLQ